ncbi:MAG: hypothetical protein RLZZ426_969 [Actinomycetota bacterium]|jgi:cell wall-associated NlpC family hydrolase
MTTPKRNRALIALTILGLSFTLLSPATSAPIVTPKVNLAEVERQVDLLQEQAATASEDWNEARIELQKVNDKIASLSQKATKQKSSYKELSKDLGSIVRSMYKTGGIDLDIQAMVATDPSSFLAHLDAINIVGARQEASLRRILAASIDLKQSKSELQSEQKKARTIAKRANARRSVVEQKLAQAERLLNGLQSADRKKRAARLAALKKAQAKKAKKANSQVISKVTSARIRKVLKYAIAQVGDRYSMGATGPSSYDCSGLTMMAYRKAGVSISHFSLAQWSQTRRVSRSQLKPGDLVFFFRGIRHVGMYIGGNRFVHAASYGTGVVISSLSETYYATRLSGFGRVIR